jgi:hypothetical protein
VLDTHADWAEKFAGEISELEEHISPSDRRRYKLPLLLRSSRRVAAFSPECEMCQNLQSQIVSLGASLAEAPEMNRQNFKGYLNIVKGITGHLKRTHGLAEERHYVKRYVFFALALGLFLVMLGLILVSFGITLLTPNITLPALVTRVIFGYTIGYLLDKKAKKRGKVL